MVHRWCHCAPAACWVRWLARWPDAEFGLVSPANLPPELATPAEVERFTGEVLKQALLQLASWFAAGKPWSVSVNVAARIFSDATFPDRLRDLALELDAPLERLTLEVTENEVFTQSSVQLETASRLRLKKVGLSWMISARECLARDPAGLPFSELKIDRTFRHGHQALGLRTMLQANLKMLRSSSYARGRRYRKRGGVLLVLGFGCASARATVFSALRGDAIAAWAASWDPLRAEFEAV